MPKNHDLEVELVELKTDIKYIKKGLDDNKKEHKDIKGIFKEYAEKIEEALKSKADQVDVDILYGRMWKAAVGIIILLIGMVGFLIKNNIDMKKFVGG